METYVITGAGLISAAGDTPQALMAALLAGKPLASGIETFDAKAYIPRRGVKDLSRTSQLVCSATAANARGLSGVAAEEVGVVLGTAWGSLHTVIEFEREAHVQGARFVDPILFTETVGNVPAGQIAILHGWSAFNATVSSGAASGSAALEQALAFLEEGRGRVAVAGGGDELDRNVLKTLRLAVPGGEGACFLTLESKAHAAARGAQPWAVVRAATARFTAERDAARVRATMAGLIREVTDAAGLGSRDIDLVVVSAEGVGEGDAIEAGAVREVLGDGPGAAPFLAPKAILGETWGASGPIGVVCAIESMRSGIVPGWPEGSQHRSMRNALVLDRNDSGHNHGMIVGLPAAV